MKNKVNWKLELLDFIKTFMICFVLVFVITTFIVKPIRVNQNSMYPTILDKSVGFSNALGLKEKNLKRFDIVIVTTAEGSHIIKRIVGLPNETIEVRDEQLYIDGIFVEQPFLDSEYYQKTLQQLGYFTEDFGPVTLKEGEIFCLGDNRPYSLDSRDSGAFKVSQVIGRGVFFVYPFDRIGGVK